MHSTRLPLSPWLLPLFLLWSALYCYGCATLRPLQPSEQQRIAGRTFVITGASSGFGRGVALALASQHANVVLAARRTEVRTMASTTFCGLSIAAIRGAPPL
jgi:NADPH:quinone reductase-like Zn-dependent oxidoreductase